MAKYEYISWEYNKVRLLIGFKLRNPVYFGFFFSLFVSTYQSQNRKGREIMPSLSMTITCHMAQNLNLKKRKKILIRHIRILSYV